MILIFIQKNEVCTLTQMMLLNLGPLMWMIKGTAVLENSVWDVVAAVIVTQFCALKSLCRHTGITEQFAIPHTAMVISFGLHSSLSNGTDLGYHF
jgi:hypothetical protein